VHHSETFVQNENASVRECAELTTAREMRSARWPPQLDQELVHEQLEAAIDGGVEEGAAIAPDGRQQQHRPVDL
jgi:hypothetical protein